MLEVAVLNAHIMYQGAGHQGVSLDDFKELLVDSSLEGTLSIETPCHGMCLNMYQMFVLTKNSSTIQ